MVYVHLFLVTEQNTASEQRSEGHLASIDQFGDIARYTLSAGFEMTSRLVWVVRGGEQGFTELF